MSDVQTYLDPAARDRGRRTAEAKTPAQREAQMLRLHNLIMRDFIKDHGVDVNTVLAMEPAILSSQITVRDVLIAVAHHFDVSPMDIISDRRNIEVMAARHAAFYLACEFTRKSYPIIGRALGGKDHTTVMHGFRKIKRKLKTDRDLQIILQNIRNDLVAKLYRES